MEDCRDRYANKTVAVTGASGYLGSALVPALQASGADVLSVGRTGAQLAAGAERLIADVRTLDCWQAIVGRADIIFHLAGNTSVQDAATDPAANWQSTVLPLIHAATAARTAGRRPRIVFASTATVYGLPDALPVGEETVPRPITAYDANKLAAEQQLELAARQGVLEAVSLRLANVYGPSPGRSAAAERGVLNAITARALQGADLELFGDGQYLRDYVYVADVVRAFAIAGVHPAMQGCFNVGSGRGTTVREVFELAADRAVRAGGTRSRIRTVAWPVQSDPIDRRSFTADINRIRAACDWAPTVSLADGIDCVIDHLVHRRGGQGEPSTPNAGPIRLNLGCGGRPLAGYINVDSDSLDRIRTRYPDRDVAGAEVFNHDIFNLPFDDDSVAEIRAESLIEHLAFADERRFFTEAVRVLEPGGSLFLTTVDFETAARQWLDAADDWRDFYRSDDDAIRSAHWFGTYSYGDGNRWGYLTATLFGNQNGAGQFHRNCYSEAKLRAICDRMGLDIEAIDRVRWQGDRDPMLALSARKRS